MLYLSVIGALAAAVFAPCHCDREHKVHNIVLYPERHSWCQTTPIKQVVALPGYEPMTIDNNVCVGACYSYSIPRTQPAEPGELIGPYCDSCQPVETRCYHVNLKADGKNTEGPRTIQKRVQIIMNCSCLSCDKVQGTDCEILDQGTAELPSDLFAILYGKNSNSTLNVHFRDDVPELLNLPKNRSEVNVNVTNLKDEHRFQLKLKLVQMIKKLADDEDANYDKSLLQHLVALLENPRHDVSDQDLLSLFNFNSDDFKLDMDKVKQVLMNTRKDDILEKHRNFGLGNFLDVDTNKNNADINRDLENSGKIYNIKNFGIEGSHAGLGRYQGNHIGMGIQPITRPESNAIPEPSRKHHHFVGEVQHVGLETGRLIKGPHDSLVLNPNVKVEQKLHLESDNVKPNQAGVVIEYENHPRESHLFDV